MIISYSRKKKLWAGTTASLFISHFFDPAQGQVSGLSKIRQASFIVGMF